MEPTPQDILIKYFGYSEFKPKQEKIITSIVKKRKDVCAIMSTGYGKSICYQIPPLLMKMPAIVITPLVSLMNDQQIQLKKRGISSYCYNSVNDKACIRNAVLNGECSVLYITPEMFISAGTHEFLLDIEGTIGIALFAIDEAHCVSLWGNSFRSSYLELGCIKEWFPDVPILAVTGTATKRVLNDMINLLKLNIPIVYRTSVDRPNLWYAVHDKTNPISDILPLLQNREPAIVYCPKRDDTESISAQLCKHGIKAAPYHAKLTETTKNDTHLKFLSGELQCIVATIAFGMGIDKRDIRMVIHYGCPRDPESYVQEVGRAGRDQLPSQCHAFFSNKDISLNKFFITQVSDPELAQYKRDGLNAIINYMKTDKCRREFLVNWFGEKIDTKNNNCCDNCSQTTRTTNKPPPPPMDTNQIKYTILRATCVKNYGKKALINTLIGKANKTDPNYNKLATIDPSVIETTFDECVSQNLLSTIKYNKYSTVYTCTINGRMILADAEITTITPQLAVKKTSITEPAHVPTKKASITEPAHVPAKKASITEPACVPAKKASIAEPACVPAKKASKQGKLTPTLQETLKLYLNGSTIREISLIRKLTPQTIEDHIAALLKLGHQLDINRLGYSNDIEFEISRACKNNNGLVLSEIKKKCKNASYLHIKIYKAKHDLV